VVSNGIQPSKTIKRVEREGGEDDGAAPDGQGRRQRAAFAQRREQAVDDQEDQAGRQAAGQQHRALAAAEIGQGDRGAEQQHHQGGERAGEGRQQPGLVEAVGRSPPPFSRARRAVAAVGTGLSANRAWTSCRCKGEGQLSRAAG
jgi:hypothetical protein